MTEQDEPGTLTGITATTRHRTRSTNTEALRVTTGKMATMSVWRQWDEHGCTATRTRGCTHHNHRRDAHRLTEFLDMLGLPAETVTITAKDRAEFTHGLRTLGTVDLSDIPPESDADEDPC